MCRLDLTIPDKEQGVCGVADIAPERSFKPAQVFRRGRVTGQVIGLGGIFFPVDPFR